MRTQHLRLVLAGLLVASLSCDGLTGPPLFLPVDLAVAEYQGSPPPASLTVDGSRVVLTGAVGTPDPCYSFSALATTKPGEVLVHLHAKSSAESCPQIPGRFTYRIEVRGMPRGSWRVVLLLGRAGREAFTLFSGDAVVE